MGSPDRVANRAFLGVSAALFAGSAALTVVGQRSMAGMGAMPIPGGGTISMVWMRMPGQTWLGMAAPFLGMWIVMMVAMMLPSLVPMLGRYRQAARDSHEAHPGRLAALVAAGYFAIWTLLGVAVFGLGVAVTAVQMNEPAFARAAPIMAGGVVLLAGALQLTGWKSQHLACLRAAAAPPATGAGGAWRHGLRLGLHCSQCSAPLVAILLVSGVMDLRAMGLVMAAITVERLAPHGMRLSRGIGIVAIAAGAMLMAGAG